MFQEADRYGGVLVNAHNQVLMREPTGHFGGYMWTFAKGRPNIGESPPETALRHVREETGYDAEILAAIPGPFAGTTSTTTFFLVGPRGKAALPGPHTASTRWVSFEEARTLVFHTKPTVGRERDLLVLRAAEEALNNLAWWQRPGTCKGDWETTPLPAKRTSFDLGWTFDAVTSLRIRKGYFPKQMEEKWFAWFDGQILYLHRSWTGFCIYEVTFAAIGDQLIAVSVSANRDPEEHGETDDQEDSKNILGLLNWLFKESPVEKQDSSLSEAILLALQPNYLGSPDVVSKIIAEVIRITVAYYQKEGSFNDVWGVVWDNSQAISVGDEYTRMPGWHTPDALGQQLLKAFEFRYEEILADDLGYFLSEAMIALSLKVLEMLRDYADDPVAEWDAHFLVQSGELHAWATSVFLGTHGLEYPGVKISDFSWKSVAI